MNQEEQWLLKEKYNNIPTPAFQQDRIRLQSGEPLAYLIGHIPFLSTSIDLSSLPLIPRPETEFWVESAIAQMPTDTPVCVLDLCAGSGCIGVAVLKLKPKTCVDFIEKEHRHHATIHHNVLSNNIDPARARIFGGDLFECAEGRYDFILSNPPYIDASLQRAEPSVLTYEPHEALFAGEHGTEFIARILEKAPEYLTDDGVLYLEHEPEQVSWMQNYATKLDYRGETMCDQFGIQRFTRFTRANSKKVQQ